MTHRRPSRSRLAAFCFLLLAGCASDDGGESGSTGDTLTQDTSVPQADASDVSGTGAPEVSDGDSAGTSDAPAQGDAVGSDAAEPGDAVADVTDDASAGVDSAGPTDTTPDATPDAAADTSVSQDAGPPTDATGSDTVAISCSTVFEFNAQGALDTTANTSPPAVYAMALSPSEATRIDTVEFFTALNGPTESDEEPSITIGVYTHVGGQGTGELLASGTTMLDQNQAWWRVALDAAVDLERGQRYWVVFEPNADCFLPWANPGVDFLPYIWGFGIGEWLDVGTNLEKPWMMRALSCN